MSRTRVLSPSGRTLLAALLKARGEWCHGYDLARETGLKSGTLYPLLIRLESRGLLDAEWQPSMLPGRPPRHAYRLTAEGERVARDHQREEGIAPDGAPVRVAPSR